MQSLWRNVFGPSSSNAAEDVLGDVRLFEDLNARERDALLRVLHRREYVAGESVFVQGEPGLGMYIIATGQVSIQNETTGRELVELGDGDVFGEIALLNEVIRTATARAKTDCTLYSLFQPDLHSLLERSPRLGVKILLGLARMVGLRLVEVSEELDSLVQQREERGDSSEGKASA
jgi:CRP-like cAMP-binding protein